MRLYRRWPLGLLAGLMAFAGLAIVGWIWTSIRSLHVQDDILTRSLHIVELRGSILQLDEVLTMSARMRAATGDPTWEKRYNDFDPLLAAAIDTICTQAAAAGLPAIGLETREANDRLVAMERKSFEFAAAGRRSEALDLLASRDYEREKARYSSGMEGVLAGLQGALADRHKRERRRAILSVIAAGILLTCVIVVLVALARQLRARGEVLLSELEVNRRTEEALAVRVRQNLDGKLKAEAALKSSQDLLQQAQKMEAVGRLAGGVAHDFNNMLCAINGYTALALEHLEPGHPAGACLTEVTKAGERASDLTRQLLAFSRRQHLQPKTIDLNAAVRDIQGMLRRLIGEDVRMSVIAGGPRCLVKADPGQLQQVILNLAVNARDAMPQGGELIIEIDRTLEEHPRAILRVMDTGEGMNEETLSHLFEPFFTTKGLGRGTGLGLSTVYGIVKQSGGEIMVKSTLGEGTTFTIQFPLVEGATADTRMETPALDGRETILIVEDEELVRSLAAAVLRKRGYTVLEASSGEEAIDILRAQGDGIRLLLSDVVMRGMSGRELMQRARQERPSLPVLMMSGYTDSQFSDGAEPPPFLQKPFTANRLALSVRSVLDGTAASP